MRTGGTALFTAAGLLATGCAADSGPIKVRAIADPGAKLREGNGDLAVARGQLALGNVGLALEAFRKLQRAQPENADVLAGIAQCYSEMGRNDLARANYEAALAIEPRNPDLLHGFAAVLDRSGQHADASEVRLEAARVRASAAATNSVAIAELPAGPATRASKPVTARNPAPGADWSPQDELAKLIADSATVRVPPAQPIKKLGNKVSNVLTAARGEFELEAEAAPPSEPAQALSSSVTVPLPPARPAPANGAKTADARPGPARREAPALSNSVTVRLPPARPAPSHRSAVVNVLSAVREDLDVAAPALSPPTGKLPAAVLPGQVTVQLPPPRAAARLRDRVTNVLAAAAEVRIAPAPTPTRAGIGSPRLERLSRGEVALVTTAEPIWRRPAVPATRTSATVLWIPLQKAARPNVVVLNAARSQGVAGRARTVLTDRGWRRIQVGDARTMRDKSVVLYPAHRQALGRSLAAQFGFAARLSPDVQVPTLLLGRDAAALRFARRA